MLAALPIEFYLMAGACIVLMGFSAFYLGSEDARARAFARLGVTVGGAALFVGTMAYLSVFVAVLIVILPVLLIIAFFTDLFGGIF